MAWVPLFKASPSLADSSITGIPARSMASAPGSSSPLYQAIPRPIMGRTIWDRGARSPDAPREPFSGINGVTPLFNMAIMVSTVSRQMPEKPLERLLTRSNRIPLAMSSLKGSPAPTAWVMIRFFCSSLHSSWEMTTSLNLPKPVVIPYTTFLSSTSSLTTCLEARIFSLLSSDKTTSAPSRHTAMIWSTVRSWPVITTFCICYLSLCDFAEIFTSSSRIWIHYTQKTSKKRQTLSLYHANMSDDSPIVSLPRKAAVPDSGSYRRSPSPSCNAPWRSLGRPSLCR